MSFRKGLLIPSFLHSTPLHSTHALFHVFSFPPTVLRCLGIPARCVTGYAVAHDCDGRLTFDFHWSNELDEPLEYLNHNAVWSVLQTLLSCPILFLLPSLSFTNSLSHRLPSSISLSLSLPFSHTHTLFFPCLQIR